MSTLRNGNLVDKLEGKLGRHTRAETWSTQSSGNLVDKLGRSRYETKTVKQNAETLRRGVDWCTQTNSYRNLAWTNSRRSTTRWFSGGRQGEVVEAERRDTEPRCRLYETETWRAQTRVVNKLRRSTNYQLARKLGVQKLAWGTNSGGRPTRTETWRAQTRVVNKLRRSTNSGGQRRGQTRQAVKLETNKQDVNFVFFVCFVRFVCFLLFKYFEIVFVNLPYIWAIINIYCVCLVCLGIFLP